MRKFITIALLVVATAAFAQAANPALVANDGVDLGNGLTGYTISGVADTDSFFVITDVTFTALPGTIFGQCLDAYNNPINTKTTADIVEGAGGTSASLDTWYFDGNFDSVAPKLTDIAGTSSLTLNSLSMIGGNLATDIPVLYIVANGNFSWTGNISVAPEGGSGTTYQVSGVTPEPATLSLLGIGAAALIRRRRK
ncbi:MAG: PEP-CTERM sorting domain-containing protein [Phycisphaerae bacterium]|nr:PEP-CTERM sorting domain-containing protein [Phycisphaerae bacterium]